MKGECWTEEQLGAADDYVVIYDHPWPKSWTDTGLEIKEVPMPRHAWDDVVICPNCNRAFLLIAAETREESG